MDVNRCLCVVCIVNFDFQFSALSGQVIRFDFLAVQIIGELHGNRRFFCGCSLIIDILAVCLPGQLVSALGELLVALYVFDVLQFTLIFQVLFRSCVLQPVGYGDLIFRSVCICIYIYGFFFGNGDQAVHIVLQLF